MPNVPPYEMTEKQNGKILPVITRKVSADGKTMVATVKNAEGKIASTTNLEGKVRAITLQVSHCASLIPPNSGETISGKG